MNMLVTYDISDPRRLARVAKIMKDYGVRVQKSIFEVDVTPRVFAQMRARAEQALEAAEDGVKYFPLCAKCSGVWLHVGQGEIGWDENEWLVL